MKPEVGMYARTLNGIVKIDKIKDCVMIDTKGKIHFGDFIKASYKIINLIEAGDYVNDEKIINIIPIDICGDEILDNQHIFTKNGEIFENEIKLVITHEQMEQISYKIKE